MKKNARKNFLPLPSLQFQLIVICFFFAICSGLLQHLLGQALIAELVSQLPDQGAKINASVMDQLVLTFGIMVPFVFGVGTLITFRYAGPLFRFERHLRQIAAGEDPGPCRLRKGDQMGSLCESINLAVDALRANAPGGAPESQEPETVEQASS